MNTNCLKGIRCPQCEAESPFRIVVAKTVLMDDDGSEDVGGDEEWGDASPCECVACGYTGPVAYFKSETWREYLARVAQALVVGKPLTAIPHHLGECSKVIVHVTAYKPDGSGVLASTTPDATRIGLGAVLGELRRVGNSEIGT